LEYELALLGRSESINSRRGNLSITCDAIHEKLVGIVLCLPSFSGVTRFLWLDEVNVGLWSQNLHGKLRVRFLSNSDFYKTDVPFNCSPVLPILSKGTMLV
jgi:hypothetical protein